MNKVLVPILIVLIVSIAIPVQTAHAIIRIDDLIIKFVVTFDKAEQTKTDITNFLNNVLFPPMRDKLIAKLDANFIDYTIKKRLTVTNLGGDTWQIYPKILFSGNTTLTQTQLDNGINSTIDDWFTVFETNLANKGASNVKYHIHKSFGSVDINGAL